MTSTSTDRINGARSSLAIKAPVKSASIANLTLSGEQTVDGVALVTGDRVLVKSQTSGADNGIYVVDTGTWARAPDADGNNDLAKGLLVAVTNGSTTSGFWQLTTANPIVVGTTSLAFSAASLGTVTAFMTTVLAAADATAAFAAIAAAALSFTGDITPAALTVSTDNWAPAGFSTASRIRVSSTLAINLTGIAAGTDGRNIMLDNVGAFAITLKDDQTSTGANRFQMAGDYVLNPDASVVLVYDATSSRWRAYGQQGSQASVSFNRLVNNAGLAVSVAASACTIALKDATGADPSSASPCTINVRSGTLATGTVNQRSVTAALSTVISSGSTGGTTSAVLSRIYAAAIDAGGTIELAWINSPYAPDENTLISTTAEGGLGAADSANVWYSTTARANVAFTILGYFESTQATAGTWATAPSKIAVNPPGDRGMVLLATQSAAASSSVDFSGYFTNEFDEYEVRFTNVLAATNTANFYARLSIAGSFLAANYNYGATADSSAGTTANGGQTVQTQFLLASSLSNAQYCSGRFYVHGPSDASKTKMHDWDTTYQDSAADVKHLKGGGSYIGGTGAIDGLRFLASSGNITSGTFSLYGIRKS